MLPSIVIHQLPAALDMQPSSFGLKLETWLRMAKVAYTVEFSPTKMGPKGKVPYATVDNKVLGDSELIIDHLTEKTGISLDDQLNPRQKAKSTVIRRLNEEHLYYILVYSRWMDEASWPEFQQLFFQAAPALVRNFISKKVQKKVNGSLVAQGIARHQIDEIYSKAATDLEALSALLGEGAYFLGDQPTKVDASVYGLLANIHYSPIRGRLQELLEKHSNLTRFCEHIKKDYWPNSRRGGGEETEFSVPQKQVA